MDYYQGVVIDYLRASRTVFVNTECCIQVNPAKNPDSSGPHWYCDAVTVDFAKEAVFLCEISYAKGLGALMKRLQEWNLHWPAVLAAVDRDCRLEKLKWPVKPWIFIPDDYKKTAEQGLQRILGKQGGSAMPYPEITSLESVVPWKYKPFSEAVCTAR